MANFMIVFGKRRGDSLAESIRELTVVYVSALYNR